MANEFTNEHVIFEGKVASFGTADETLALKNIKLEKQHARLILSKSDRG